MASSIFYPAAGLVHYAPLETPICVVDPNKPELSSEREVFFIEEPATTGLPKLVQRLLAEA